jgi:type IV secretion system protein VirD4
VSAKRRINPNAIICRAMLIVACASAAAGAALLVASYPVLPAMAVAAIVLHNRRTRKPSGAFGTARFADTADLYAGGWLGNRDGLILGSVCDAVPPGRLAAIRLLLTAPLAKSATACRLFLGAFWSHKWSPGGLLRLRQFTHLACFAATGRGKGIYYVINTLLTWRHSCVCLDPKGENYILTHEHRRAMEHEIVRIDPFEVCGPGGASFNPLGLIDPSSPRAIDYCRAIAKALVPRSGDEKEPFYPDSAELFISAFCTYVVCAAEPHQRNLQTVRELLTDPAAFRGAVKLMQQSDACGGMLKRLANQVSCYTDRELAATKATIATKLEFLDTPLVAAATSSNSFSPYRLKRGGMTLYLVMPADQLKAKPGLTRLYLDGLLRCLTEGPPDESHQVLFILDEVAQLGRLESLETAVELYRGWGLRLFFFFQSINQIEKCFGEHAATFLDNIDTQITFGQNNASSAELLQKRLGTATIAIESSQSGTSHSQPTGGVPGSKEGGQLSTSSNTTFSETGKPLMRLEEILQMEGTAIITHRSQRPILARLVPYFSEDFKRMAAGPARLGPGAFAAAGVLLLGGVALAACAALAMPPAAPEMPNAGFYRGQMQPEALPAGGVEYRARATQPPLRRAVSPPARKRPQASPYRWRESGPGTPLIRAGQRESRASPALGRGGGVFAVEASDEDTDLSLCHLAGAPTWTRGRAQPGDLHCEQPL